MAYQGQVIENKVSGERITFLRTAADTDGELLAFECELTADGKVPGKHVHPNQEERFEVIEGRMEFKLGRKTIHAGPGEVVVVPAGASHKFRNGGDDTAVVRVEVRPALKMEQLLETVCEYAETGRVLRTGMPKPLELAVFVKAFKDEVHAPFPPAAIQRASLAPLRAIARLRDRRRRGRLVPAYA